VWRVPHLASQTRELPLVSTQRTFTAAAPGAVNIGVASNVGEVLVTVNPTVTRAKAVVSTSASVGPYADAVRGATAEVEVVGRENRMCVEVPEIAATVIGSGGSTYNFAGSFNIGGNVTPGNAGSLADAVSGDTITVHLTVPPGSSVVLETRSANLRVEEGDLHVIGFRALSGSVTAQGVNVLAGETTSGAVTAGHVKSAAAVRTASGDVTFTAYSGEGLEVDTASGVVDLTATAQASGKARVTTVSSVALVRGAAYLDLEGRSVSGQVIPL
jgi:hypothetical protein